MADPPQDEYDRSDDPGAGAPPPAIRQPADSPIKIDRFEGGVEPEALQPEPRPQLVREQVRIRRQLREVVVVDASIVRCGRFDGYRDSLS
jgi:hypothetical protein